MAKGNYSPVADEEGRDDGSSELEPLTSPGTLKPADDRLATPAVAGSGSRGCLRRRAGLLAAAGGTFTFALMTVSVRILPWFGPPLPTFMIIVVRASPAPPSSPCMVHTLAQNSHSTQHTHPQHNAECARHAPTGRFAE